ncbi:MAG TPA: hypothetical protein VIK18_14930 [Pirellulales bacterium]
MLDFGQNRWSAPNYQGRSQQRRLLLLMVTAGMVLAAVLYAADPKSWDWVSQLSRKRAGDRQAAVDTRLQPRRADEPIVVARGPQAAAVPKAGKFFTDVDAKSLAAVRDDTPLRRQELPAMFQLLSVARRADPRALAQASLGTPAFVQLLRQPESFRGQLVTLRGRVHGVIKLPAGDIPGGVRELFQLWLQPENDGSNPIVIQCLDLPKAFPRGEHLDEQIEATGFYFKRLAYVASDHSMRLAPLILAESVDWIPKPPGAAAPQPIDWKQLAWGVTLALVAAAVLLAFALPRRRGPADTLPRHAASGKPAAGLAQLDELRSLEVSPESREALERIAELEQDDKRGEP